MGEITLELVLNGNGLQLSPTFCTRTNVSIFVDEILTSFRCCVVDKTVLWSDVVGLRPNFVVIVKFIGCAVILEDISM